MLPLFTDELISGVTMTELTGSIKSSDSEGAEVVLSMPKFKIEYQPDSLIETLEKLGVRGAFSPIFADLGNLLLEVSFIGGIKYLRNTSTTRRNELAE